MRLSPLKSLTPADRDAWKRLAAAAVEPNPFYESDFVHAVAAAEPGEVQILHEVRGEEWVACLPVRRRRLAGVRVLSAWKSPYSYLGTPLVERESLARFSTALARSLGAAEFARFLLVQRLSEGPVAAAIEAACAEGGLAVLFARPDSRAALLRKPDADYLSGLKSRRRSELRRQRKKLQEELGGELAATEPSSVESAVTAFLELEASGWKGENGTAMASQSQTAELFRSVCNAFAAEERLLLRGLQADGRIVAMTCDLVAGDTVFGFKTAYDEGLRRYSPGIQLQIENFSSFHENRGERLLDSCSEPGNEQMNWLWPDRREVATVLLGPSGPFGRAVGRAVKAVDGARRRRSQRQSDD